MAKILISPSKYLQGPGGRSGATSCAGGKITEAARVLAELCFNTLMDEGVKANQELVLKVQDLQAHMRSITVLLYWKRLSG